VGRPGAAAWLTKKNNPSEPEEIGGGAKGRARQVSKGQAWATRGGAGWARDG